MSLFRHEKNKPEDLPAERFYAYFDMRYKTTPSYWASLSQWKRHFPEEQIYVGFFDRLLESPASLLEEICAFLDIDVGRMPEHVLNRLVARINPGVKFDIPQHFAAYLARQYRPHVEELCEIFRPYPQQWLEECDQLLSRGTT